MTVIAVDAVAKGGNRRVQGEFEDVSRQNEEQRDGEEEDGEPFQVLEVVQHLTFSLQLEGSMEIDPPLLKSKG